MAIKQHTCFTAHCDECKASYENGDGITLHYDSTEEARGEAEGYDWTTLPDGRLICDNCVYRMSKAGVIELDHSDDPDAPAYRVVAASDAKAVQR